MKIIWKIIKESWKVLIIASILSSIGGFGLKTIQEKLVIFLPLLIALPALNDMIGDFGTIITAKFTTSLFEGKIKKPLIKSYFVKHLFKDIMPIALFMAVYISLLSVLVALFMGFETNFVFFLKMLLITLVSTASLVILIFLVAIIGGYKVYKNKEDPDDILIPITTSIADLGTMIIFSGLIYLLF